MAIAEIEVGGGLEVEPLIRHLAAHAVPGAEVSDPGASAHTRVLRTPEGLRSVTVRVTPDRVLVESDAAGGDESDLILRKVREWLDLDVDLTEVREALGGDPVVGPLIEARPGLRVVGYPDGFEGAIMTLLGQQVSLAAARTFGGRLTARYGSPGPGGLTAFPDPQRLLGEPVEDLRAAVGITGARARAIQSVAGAFAEGLVLDPTVDRAATRARLLEVTGVGPWTVEYLAVRALRDPDAFTAGDLVLRRALGGISAKEASAASEAWRPWRAYALFHLWTAEAFD